MATYTPEQIREFTKGMSDKQIAESAQQFNVSPTQLAGAFNMPREDVTQRAEAAGVPLASTAYEAYQNMQAGGSQDTTMDMLRSSVGMPPQGTGFTPEQYQSYAESLKGMDPFNIKNKVLEDKARFESQGYTLDSDTVNQYLDPTFQASIKEFGGPGPTLGGPTQTLDLAQTGGSPVTTGVDTTGITVPTAPPVPTFTAEQQQNIRNYAQRSANTFAAGVSPQEIQQQYIKDLATLPEGMRAQAEQIFAQELESSRPDLLQQFREAVATAPPAPAPSAPSATPAPATPAPVEIPEVADVTVADSTGAPVTYQYGSQINDQLAEAWTSGSQSGDYTQVNALLNQAGYTLDDVQKQFNIDEDGMAALKAAGITGVSPENSAIAGLWEQITELQAQNEDYSSQVTALNGLLGGIGLTMDDLKSRFALDDEDVQFVESLGVLQPTGPQIQDTMVQRAMTPSFPVDPVTGQPVGQMDPAKIGEATPEQIIGGGIGQAPVVPTATAQTAATTAQAMQPTTQTAAQVTAQDATPSVTQALQQVSPAQGSVSTQAQVEAAQMSPTATEVGTLGAAQIAQAQQVQQPQSRTLQSGEVVTAAANAEQAAAFAEQVTAATANATQAATVQGQLADLMTQFEDGAVPAWAAGAMRTANATLAARGLGSSSIAGQAIVQAAMEAALPIASQDAQTVAQFELTNLSNRQQRAMLSAQQRAQFIGQEFDQEFQARVANAAKISDIANLNFNAEQQVALENARLAQSVDLANLQNTQALVMAEAAQIGNLETTNLNNRQQAAVQNAQAFLQMDLTNLSNQQQTDMFKAQSSVQALLSDQAAENAARQFNASSENQTNQFFANLKSQISQFNATQNNAMDQFNAEQSNVVSRFNAELEAQRDQFNAQNQLVIEQSNAQWRREISTADTAAQNLANQFNAQAILEISNTAYAQLWQSYRDDMEFAWTSGENERDRLTQLAVQKLQIDASKYAANASEDGAFASALGLFAGTVVSNW